MSTPSSSSVTTTDIETALRWNQPPAGVRDEVLPGLSPGQIGLSVGPGGCGKSFLALLGAVELAVGRTAIGGVWGDARSGGQRVIYLTQRDDAGTDMQERLGRLLKELSIEAGHPEAELLRRNLAICSHRDPARFTWEDLPIHADAHPPRLIIIDPVWYLAGYWDTDPAAVAAYLKRKAVEFGCAFLLVDNETSSLAQHCDNIWHVTSEEGGVEIEWTSNRVLVPKKGERCS